MLEVAWTFRSRFHQGLAGLDVTDGENIKKESSMHLAWMLWMYNVYESLRMHDFIALGSIKARLAWLKRMLINWEGKSNAASLTAVHWRLSDFIVPRSIKTRVYHSTPSISAGSSRIHDHSGHYPRDMWVATRGMAFPTGHFISLFKTGPQGITYRAP